MVVQDKEYIVFTVAKLAFFLKKIYINKCLVLFMGLKKTLSRLHSRTCAFLH